MTTKLTSILALYSICALIVLLVMCLPVSACEIQEADEAVEEVESKPAAENEEKKGKQDKDTFNLSSYIVAAGWCSIYSSKPKPGAVGCDYGVGARLLSIPGLPRAGIAAVVGPKSAGIGFVWLAHSNDNITIAGAVGVIAPRDDFGINSSLASLAVGCTFGLGN